MNIDKSDRKLLIWAGVFMFLVIVALAVLSPDESESGIPSTYSAQGPGAKAAFLLLQDAGYKVERWEHSPNELPDNPAHTVLVLASPFRPPLAEEKIALQNYVNRGGKILATGMSSSFYLPHAESDAEFVPSPKEYQ